MAKPRIRWAPTGEGTFDIWYLDKYLLGRVTQVSPASYSFVSEDKTHKYCHFKTYLNTHLRRYYDRIFAEKFLKDLRKEVKRQIKEFKQRKDK